MMRPRFRKDLQRLLKSAPVRPRLLLVSHTGERCGVQQFGRRLFDCLQTSPDARWHYAEPASLAEFQAELARVQPVAVLFNNQSNMHMPWLTDPALRNCPVPLVYMLHEGHQLAADQWRSDVFSHAATPDPTLLPHNPRVIPLPRFIPPPRPPAPPPDRFTVGSFGFATPGKGFERLCALVNDQMDDARIRINIPPHDLEHLVPQRSTDELVPRCRARITKPGITLDFTHDFMDEDALLDFLGANTINVFFYDEQAQRGVSSCTDYALACGRPLAVSRSALFRNLHGVNPVITAEDRPLAAIVASGVEPLRHLVRAYAPDSAGAVWTRAMLDVAAAKGTAPAGPVTPEPRDATTLLVHAARHLAAPVPDPVILAVTTPATAGALAALRGAGFRVDGADWNGSSLVTPPDLMPGSCDIVLCDVAVPGGRAGDHRLLRALADLLAPGGVLAVACPVALGPDTRRDLLAAIPDCAPLDPPSPDPRLWLTRRFSDPMLRRAMRALGRLQAHDPAAVLARCFAPFDTVNYAMLSQAGSPVFRGEAPVIEVPAGQSVGAFLLYGPYVACDAGRFECVILLNVSPADLPSDTPVLAFDTASEATGRGDMQIRTWSSLTPGLFQPLHFTFEVPVACANLETRLMLLAPVGLTLVAAVAQRRIT